mmetsp:Transcript_14256/g.35764  ORF Transcript_14256/g.35764 Transcript_14256/m.35764 type:complete len:260 (-) Transcript_14256:34-813(-)
MDQRLIQIENKAFLAGIVGMDFTQEFRAVDIGVFRLNIVVRVLCFLARQPLGCLVVFEVRARETAAHHSEAVHKGVACFFHHVFGITTVGIVVGFSSFAAGNPLCGRRRRFGLLGGSNRVGRPRSGSVAIRIGLCDKVGNRSGGLCTRRFGNSRRPKVSASAHAVRCGRTPNLMVVDTAGVNRQVRFVTSVSLLLHHLCIVVWHSWMHTAFSTAADTTTGRSVLLAAFLSLQLSVRLGASSDCGCASAHCLVLHSNPQR